MTLHKAIIFVLEAMDGSTTAEIANEINTRNLYQRKDKNNIQASQISARINKYPELFRRLDNKIFLSD